MTNMQGKSFHENQTQSGAFALNQTIKKRIRTVMPGIIQSYDATKRRATVKPALRNTYTDGSPSTERPAVPDAPVIFPMGGDFEIVWPLKKDNEVLIAYPHRGLDNYKETLGMSDPDDGEILSPKDAIVLPLGFSGDAGSTDALTLRMKDGTDVIELNFTPQFLRDLKEFDASSPTGFADFVDLFKGAINITPMT